MLLKAVAVNTINTGKEVEALATQGQDVQSTSVA